MKQSLARAVLSMVLVAGATFSLDVYAGPSIWKRAQDPQISVHNDQIREAQKALFRYRRMRYGGDPQMPSLAELVLRDARRDLARIVQAGPVEFSVRLLYAQVLYESRAYDDAVVVLEKLLADHPPAPIRADALGDLAVLHAHAGRREQEIAAYTKALEIEPHSGARGRLLANRAEALMAIGDIIGSIEGYRESLSAVTTLEMYLSGSTTLFGLGVALDRSGNPEAGMQAVDLARSYDPADRGLRRPSWFFSPPHDGHWYWALGAWTCARRGSGWAARSECYERSLDEWQRYIDKAPDSDPWVSLARVRKQTVMRERERFEKDFERQKKAAPPSKGTPSP